MHRRLKWLGILLSALAFFAVAPVQGGPVAEKWIPNGQVLGNGTLRWFAFKVYDARLYASSEWDNKKPWHQVPLVLELTYARAIKGKQIAQASSEEIARLSDADPAKVLAWSTAMEQLFPDVFEGDKLVGVYHPDRSISFYYNHKPLTLKAASPGGPGMLGVLGDPSFGRAFFSIWLDERTRDRSLRADLLGRFSEGSASLSPSGASKRLAPTITN